MDKILNAWIRELSGVMKWVDEKIDGGSAIWREWRMIGLLKGYM